MRSFKTYLKKTEEVGTVEEVIHSMAYVRGLPNAKISETVLFESSELGQIISLNPDYAEVLVFSSNVLSPGTKVARTDTALEIPVGKELLGGVLDPLGNSFDKTKASKTFNKKVPIDVIPSGIESREIISLPLNTGVILVDNLIPLGKGQRELVIGDRKTGKTNFLLQTMLSQAKQDTICIYAAIAKRKTDIKKVDDFISKNNIRKNTLIVASNSSDPLGLIFLTPYSAMSIAEFFRDQGKDVLIVFDDLTTHAKYYREISLLGKRFPGRNSYPGDIFFAHAKLLERGGNFATKNGPKAITCLPVAATIEGDISGYIQTNLMSMTDGHIYFDKDFFSKGRRPAINHFLSVTRVGRQTQNQLESQITRELTTFLGLYEKTQSFLHFGAELSEDIKTTIELGEKILEFFNQEPGGILPINLQIVILAMIWSAYWQEKSLIDMKFDISKIESAYYKNSKFMNLIDDMVKSSDTFNHLIPKVSKNSEIIMSRAKK